MCVVETQDRKRLERSMGTAGHKLGRLKNTRAKKNRRKKHTPTLAVQSSTDLSPETGLEQAGKFMEGLRRAADDTSPHKRSISPLLGAVQKGRVLKQHSRTINDADARLRHHELPTTPRTQHQSRSKRRRPARGAHRYTETGTAGVATIHVWCITAPIQTAIHKHCFER